MRCSRLIVLLMVGTAAWGGCFCLPEAEAMTIAHWRFENNLLDETGVNGATHPTASTYSPDIFGSPVPRTGATNSRSLELDNTLGNFNATDHLRVEDHSSLDFATGSFTIEAFVKLNRIGSNRDRQYLLQKNAIDGGDEASSFIFMAKVGSVRADGLNQAVMALAFPDSTVDAASRENYIFSSLEINDFDWHHISVAVNRTSGDVRFTLDDAVDFQAGAASSSLFDGQLNDSPLYIGAHPNSTAPTSVGPLNHGFDGFIDELRISDEFLSTSQLLAVPEPSASVTITAGIVILLAWRRWRRRGRR